MKKTSGKRLRLIPGLHNVILTLYKDLERPVGFYNLFR